MKLSECIYGVLVKANKACDNKPVYKVGMVIGITENSFKEAIPLVQWQDGETRGCYQGNLSKLED